MILGGGGGAGGVACHMKAQQNVEHFTKKKSKNPKKKTKTWSTRGEHFHDHLMSLPSAPISNFPFSFLGVGDYWVVPIKLLPNSQIPQLTSDKFKNALGKIKGTTFAGFFKVDHHKFM